MEQALNSLGQEKVVSIMYHMNWPSPGNDPWYFNNVGENTTRRSYYGVNAIPYGYMDGTQLSSLSSSYVMTSVNNRFNVTSPYDIEVSGDVGTNSVTVKVKATSTPPTGTKMLRVAVVEKEYVSPTPFPNGETLIRTAMLDMVPDGVGTPINIAVGDSQTFNFNYNVSLVNFHPSLHLTIVAFIQNDTNKEVLQAGYFDGTIGLKPIQGSTLIDTNQTATLSGVIKNDFTSSTSINFRIKGQIPPGWNVTANTPQGNIPLNTVQQVTIPGSDSLTFDINIDPQGHGGGMQLLAKIMGNDTTAYDEVLFNAVTKGVDILVVDDDGGADYETYALDALSSVPMSYGVIPINSGDLSSSDLEGIPVIIWVCGTNSPTLTEDDINALAFYLDFGGTLFLTGADISYELGDPSSPYYSAYTESFLHNYLHSNYVSKMVTILNVNGVSGDIIGDGISGMKLFGGTGANNMGSANGKWPDEIAPRDSNAYSSFSFFSQPNRIAVVRSQHYSGRVVFMPFCFEAIASEANRNLVMERAVNWLYQATDIPEPKTPVALDFELNQNYPNPFNPSTTIRYSLDQNGSGNTRLVIFNTLGQKVRTLVNEKQPAGRYSVSWDGKDDLGREVGSGVYFYQLINGSRRQINKMILMR